MAENLWEFLELKGHVMDHAADGPDGLRLALANSYDVIVLDIGLPRMDGIALCERYRSEGGNAPVLMLTARDQLEDKLLGFEAGADDYLTKPFELHELAARLQVLHRRQQRQSATTLVVADLSLEVAERRAHRDGRELPLNPTGFRLLHALMQRSPHVVAHAELAQALWGDVEYDSARLHTHISLLRAVVDREFEQPLILTVHGFGYRIVAPVAA